MYMFDMHTCVLLADALLFLSFLTSLVSCQRRNRPLFTTMALDLPLRGSFKHLQLQLAVPFYHTYRLMSSSTHPLM
jgi:hypothetical protein